MRELQVGIKGVTDSQYLKRTSGYRRVVCIRQARPACVIGLLLARFWRYPVLHNSLTSLALFSPLFHTLEFAKWIPWHLRQRELVAFMIMESVFSCIVILDKLLLSNEHKTRMEENNKK